MTTLYLVRHGETVDNAAKIIQGQRHGELSPVGVVQMDELADLLSDTQFDVIVSSDLKRAYESATILSEKMNLTVTTTFLLRERDWGDFTGRYISDLKRLPLPVNVEKSILLLFKVTLLPFTP